MTDDDAGDVRGPDLRSSPASGPAAPAGGSGTAGGMIRAAREAQGIDLGTFAAMLKIPMKKLEALEADRHDELPGASFERALAQAACRALQIDPRPVLALLPANATSLERVAGGLNEPFRERPPTRADLGEPSLLLRPAVLLPALLVVAAAALFFLPAPMWQRVSRQASELMGEGASAPAAAVPAASVPGVTVMPIDQGTGTAAPVPMPVPMPVASEPLSGAASQPSPAPGFAAAPAVAPLTAAAVPASASLPSPGASAAAPVAMPAGNAALVVTARQQTWVEVVDAQGRTLVSRTVVAGESVSLEGAMPMKLKIGNASGTTVTLRGQNLDLTPWVRDNVARLQLK